LSVPCPRCGREYDVTLFEFGRTIHCACGTRVGRERRVRIDVGAEPPRFLADAMLGALARWLRILGFDCAYEADIADETLVRRAVAERRAILTRDRALPDEWRVSGVHVLSSEDPRQQLREERVPPHVRATRRTYRRCPVCERVYWRGTHTERMGRVVERVLSEA
jgi:uncharacterized protein with PIN domain